MYCHKCGQDKRELIATSNYDNDSEDYECWFCGAVTSVVWTTLNGETIPIRVIEAQRIYSQRLVEDETIH